MISQSTIDRIKELAINEVIAHYVDLKKAGSSYRGKSPWNDENTPSFYVVPAKGIFKDFSSGKAGDAITFVMEHKNLTYPEAIKEIAGKVGERVEYDEKPTEEQKTEHERREILLKVNAAAARKYHQLLMAPRLIDFRADAAIDAIGEMIKRQFTIDTIIQWQIGYAPGNVANGYKPNAWKFITELVGDRSRQEAHDVGLIQTKNGHTYDVFRHRVMYPIHDHHGRVVGFGGRALQEDQYNAKYINTAETKVFDKKKTLYGLHFAGAAIRKVKHANLVEGYCDVISMHQAGFNNTVGTCGTALTEEQCKLLRKYTDKVVLFLDGDKAGQDATLRAIDLLVQHGFQTGVVPMPAGDELPEGVKIKDPDDLVRYFKQVA